MWGHYPDHMAKILINVAWPYANGPIHLGHVAGSLLPPDIFSRYNRLIGNDVLMVGGSDQHGTPITVTADKEGVTPEEVADRYHEMTSKAIRAITAEKPRGWDDEAVKGYGSLLYDEAMLLQGYDIEDKAGFVAKLNELLINASAK